MSECVCERERECVCARMRMLSCVCLFVTPWTVAHQTPLSVGFPRPEYWSGLTFPQGDLLDEDRAYTHIYFNLKTIGAKTVIWADLVMVGGIL